MKRIRATIWLPVLLAVLSAGAGNAAPAPQAATVGNFFFSPVPIVAAPGATITWTWAAGSFSHNVTAYSGATFASTTRTSGTFSATYPGGTVLYRCTLHSSSDGAGGFTGMVGSIAEDSTPPAAPAITSPANGSLHGSTVTFSGTSSSDTVRIRLREGATSLGQGSASGGTWTLAVTLTSGTHVVRALAEDAAGNESALSNAVTVDVDATPPTVAITSPAPNSATGSAVTVQGIAGDERTLASVSVRATGILPPRSPVSVPASCPGCGTASSAFSAVLTLAPGVYELVATAVDGLGNTATTPARTIVVLV